ncbi:MAG: histidine kinase dimerization/phospho-acceptor domain-containing protein [Gemmatimonadota bacterium]
MPPLSNSSSPRYLLAGPRVDLAGIRSELDALAPFEVVQNVDDLLGETGDGSGVEPGWVLVPGELEPSVTLDLFLRLAGRSGDWSVLLMDRAPGSLEIVPVSPGFRTDLISAASRLDEGGAGLGLLSFRHSLTELARIRHDINNPLTAALAEAQLVLMDVEPGTETAASLQAVEEQLRRIRDLVAQLTALRVPAPRAE